MNTGLKTAIIALYMLIAVIVITYVYRLFFAFRMADVKAYAEQYATGTSDPAAAYMVIINGCQHILFSIDLTEQVKILAINDGISKEQELVQTAICNAQAAGLLQ